MSQPLSPAAQAVLDAVVDGALPPFHVIARPMAAALRAAADQVVPHARQPELHGSRTCSTAWQRWDERCEVHFKLLIIAAELEADQ
jgi:hypothetical protein